MRPNSKACNHKGKNNRNDCLKHKSLVQFRQILRYIQPKTGGIKELRKQWKTVFIILLRRQKIVLSSSNVQFKNSWKRDSIKLPLQQTWIGLCRCIFAPSLRVDQWKQNTSCQLSVSQMNGKEKVNRLSIAPDVKKKRKRKRKHTMAIMEA